MSFGRGSKGNEYTGPTESKTAKVTNIKPSTERGKKRISVVEKTGSRKAFTVDIDIDKARGLSRKELYNFELYEKDENNQKYGGMQRRDTKKMKTYMCDETPEKHTGGSKSQFKSFGDNKPGSGSAGRDKF